MPNYTEFELLSDDAALIGSATDAGGKIDWDNKAIAPIKARVKNLHMAIQGESCCYCRKSLHGEFNMVIDIEHVLPKGEFPRLTFEPVNLSVACKRCNMLIKGECWSFVGGLTKEEVVSKVNESSVYDMIHPNLDVYSTHLNHISVDIDGARFRKFLSGSATKKGKFTYEFFELEKLEVERLDQIQGLMPSADTPLKQMLKTLEALMGVDI